MARESRTIVLIHGLWMTPRSWENFRKYYEVRGFRVIAPAWPGMKGEVEHLRQDATSLQGLGVTEIADHYEKIVRKLSVPPILIGHSFGGLIVQILLDRGLGAAGVAIDSVAPQGVLALPLSALKSASPALLSPANYWGTVPLSFKEFQYAFANTMSEVDAIEAYERYAIPGPGRPIFQAASANLNPFAATRVNYNNGSRAPLLLIAGTEDHQIPPSLNRENFRKYSRSKAVTEFKEFAGRSHLIIAQEGWKEVAEYSLSWSLRQVWNQQTLVAAQQANAKPRLSGVFYGLRQRSAGAA
jgi:pimeloyl-ACP methyl ester carboxylesterase